MYSTRGSYGVIIKKQENCEKEGDGVSICQVRGGNA
jgi:hypothetical protein